VVASPTRRSTTYSFDKPCDCSPNSSAWLFHQGGWLEAAGLASSAPSFSVIGGCLRTRLVRFLISLRKPAQHVFSGMYCWVPVQRGDRSWADADLYKKYRITKTEIAFVNSIIRPMGECNE
jgi:site-specific DNA-methyltransferase (adenine-specific)